MPTWNPDSGRYEPDGRRKFHGGPHDGETYNDGQGLTSASGETYYIDNDTDDSPGAGAVGGEAGGSEPKPIGNDFDRSMENVPILGSLLGSSQRQQRARAAEKERQTQRRLGELWNMIPNTVALEEETQAGEAEADPEAIRHQMEALDQLAMASRGEYSEIDKARQEQMLRRNAMQERAQREAALAAMEARGMGQSGTGAISALQAGQASANRSSQEGMQIEALAQQRALQAMNARAGTAGQARGQSFDESYRRGTAVDEFNRRNANTLNEFRQQRYENRQGVVDRETGKYNQQAEQARQREREAQQQGNSDTLALLSLLA